jgi:HK97 family phage prohead protease
MKLNKETRYVPATELRAVTNDDGTRTISGYAAVFNSNSVDMGFIEIIAPGAFTKTLASNPDVVCLRDHDVAILLGRTTSKTLTLQQDNVGLKFTCALPDTSQARDLTALMERGDVDKCSFTFISMDDEWSTNAAGKKVRTVNEATLLDVSVVTFPAYPDTSVAVRNAPAEIRSALEERDDMDDDSSSDDATPEPVDTDCLCDCGNCVSGDCEGCTEANCALESCDCSAASNMYQNRAHMIITLARLKN